MIPKETVDCLLCGGKNAKQLYPSLPAIVRCACGLVYANPRLTKEAIVEFYSKDYFENRASQEMGYDNYVQDKELVELTFRRRLSQLTAQWIKRPGAVLDVGCATGFFLSIARQMGWQAHGVEISEYCCDYARDKFGLILHRGLLQDWKGPEASFDLVTLWDYLEHSRTPNQDIQKAYELLAPSGLLALTTPDVGSWPARLFKTNWIGFKAHEHLYYFTKNNLTRLLREYGFKILSASYAGKYISPKFFAKRLGSYSKSLGALAGGIARLPGVNRLRFYCNPYDIVYLVAQK